MKIKGPIFILIISAIASPAFAQCNVSIPAHATVITSSATLLAGGEVVWVCQGGSVTDQGGADTIYLEQNCTCISNGGGAVIYAKAGCNVTLNGASEVVFYEPGATINNIGGAMGMTICASVIYNYSKAPSPGCTSTGVNEEMAKGGISLYPNPASEFLTIELPKWEEGVPVKVMIHNSLGSVAYESNVTFSLGEAKIDVSKFPRGIYLLSVSNGEDRYAELFIVR